MFFEELHVTSPNESVSRIRYKLACAYREDSNQSAHPHSLMSLSFFP